MQCIENYSKKKRKLRKAFVDLEKSHDREPKDILKCTLAKESLPMIYGNIIEDMYERASIKVKSIREETKDFESKLKCTRV